MRVCLFAGLITVFVILLVSSVKIKRILSNNYNTIRTIAILLLGTISLLGQYHFKTITFKIEGNTIAILFFPALLITSSLEEMRMTSVQHIEIKFLTIYKTSICIHINVI